VLKLPYPTKVLCGGGESVLDPINGLILFLPLPRSKSCSDATVLPFNLVLLGLS